MAGYRWGFVALGLGVAVAVSAGPGAAQETAEQAGVASAVVNRVEVSGPPRATPVLANIGMPMYLEDRIVTEVDARLQVMLLDETIFTVGPQSDLTIDRFVYDPATGTGEIAAQMTTGFLRYVSGHIGSADPASVSIDTPAATIGIRGSALVIAKLPEPPNTYYCGVLGPGKANNALAREGACIIENEFGSVEIRRAGYGAAVTLGSAPGAIEPLGVDLLQRLQTGLRPSGLQRAAAADATPGPAADGATGGAAPAALGSKLAFQPVDVSGEAVAQTRQITDDQTELLGISFNTLNQRAETDAVDTRNAQTEFVDNVEDVIDGIRPGEIAVPFFAQLTWQTIPDLDLVATGPNPSGSGRYRVFFGDPAGPTVNLPGGRTGPSVLLDDVRSNIPLSEVLTVNSLIAGGPTRISVFNFSDSAINSTSLSQQSEAVVSLLRNGLIERGPGNTLQVNGQLVDAIAVPKQGAGNTFVAYEISPTGKINRIGELTNSANVISVK